MDETRIGIIKEGKSPPDRRVPFTPAQLQGLIRTHPRLRICVQSSSVRCFPDEAYQAAGVEVVSNVSDCLCLFGVKEVPVEQLLPEKTYFFFSHTAKLQAHNRGLLQEVLRKRIRLVDYEYLVDEKGKRQVAFGRYAGIVGAHNALWAYGLKTGSYSLPRAYACRDYKELLGHYRRLKLPPLRVVLTGTGRVGQGAVEILQAAGFMSLSPANFLRQEIDTPVYTQLSSVDYHCRKDGTAATSEAFHSEPAAFVSTFLPFAERADILIAAAYWDPRGPLLFRPEDAAKEAFRVRLIADISCDIEGSIPSTKRASTIKEPLYSYDPKSDSICPFSVDSPYITVMAVDNLPCELPVDASQNFGEQLIDSLLPYLLYQPDHPMLEGATIAQAGALTKPYTYLESWLKQPHRI